MRLTSFLVLATTALLAFVDIVSAETTITRNTPAAIHSNSDNVNELSAPKRMLRTHDEDYEERAGPEKLTGLITSGAAKMADSDMLNSHLLLKTNGVQFLKELKLGDDIATALQSSKMDTLATYVNLFNKKHPDSKISVIRTLTAHYGDDAVARALVVATENGNTVERVSQLRRDQLVDCQKSVDDVFNLLKLRDNDYAALSTRKLEVLEDYIRFVNTKTNGQESLAKAFTAGFGGERNVALILRAATTDTFARKKALELEDSLIKLWLSSGYKPERVLKTLRLDKDITRALKNVNLWTLGKYITAFNTNHPNNKMSTFGTLTAHYGDDDVLEALRSAMRALDTKKMAIRLQTEQLDDWFTSGKSVDDVFNLLKLGDDGFAFISSPKLDRLDDYIKFVNSKASGQTTLLQALKSGFGERELAVNLVQANTYARGSAGAKAKPLQEAQFTQWLDEGYDSISVLTKLFKVDETKLNTASMMGETVASQFKQFYEKANGVSTKVEPRRS
ncbi:hypothetical protein PF004_g24081 [Phytophthora fragariae]|uniref:RxLR effector protein n=1 Tax=Phytophthora fragariae TaxID=53985 RepID=A0A6G0MW26_9STRA|nr:hypothetical protein PF004_g24081 [Phytophthora fragariae]